MQIYQPIISGSLLVVGNTTITGSLSITNGVTGSLFGTSSWSTTASYVTGSIFGNGNSALSSSYSITASYALSSPRQFFTASIGNGSAVNIGVTHNLNTRDIIVQVYDNSTFDTVLCDIVRTTTSSISCSFTVAPTSNQYRVVISS